MRRRAFTLIELLVVVALLALLAAFLLPVFGTVRENGRRAACQSNLHQIGLAMQRYVQDSDHRYLPVGDSRPYPLLAYVGDSQVFLCPDTSAAQKERLGRTGGISLGYGYDYARLVILSANGKSFDPVSDAEIARPAALWLYQDSARFFWRKLPAPCGHPVLGSTLHSGGGNYLFADGHVQWLTPESLAIVTCTNGPLRPPFKVEAGL